MTRSSVYRLLEGCASPAAHELAPEGAPLAGIAITVGGARQDCGRIRSAVKPPAHYEWVERLRTVRRYQRRDSARVTKIQDAQIRHSPALQFSDTGGGDLSFWENGMPKGFALRCSAGEERACGVAMEGGAQARAGVLLLPKDLPMAA
jgi:hypothetical protein